VEPNEEVLIKKHLVDVDLRPLVKSFA